MSDPTHLDLLGLHEEYLTWYQMTVRALIVFVSALLIVRIAGIRSFGLQSAFSIVLSLTVGSVLSRAITGHYPFFSCLAGAITLAVLHRIVAHISYSSRFMGLVAKGEAIKLIENGEKIDESLALQGITDRDLQQAMRKCAVDDMEKVKEAWLERDGSISIIRKEND